MHSATHPAPTGEHDLKSAIESFLGTARLPAVLEPGSDPIPIEGNNFVLSGTALQPRIECWSTHANLVRRIVAIRAQRRGKLELRTEQFGGKRGELFLIDLADATHAQTTQRKSERLKFREQFRLALHRQYPDWRISEISTEQDLEHSLSPNYPRALLRRGMQGMAAIGCSETNSDPDGVLSFGLIWLSYLRRREPRLSIGGLLVFLPIGAEVNTCHRVRHLDPARLKVAVFVHGHGMQVEEAVHPEDYTNFATRVEQSRSLPTSSNAAQYPEASLERQIRAHLEQLDGTLLPEPVYSQAPNLASAHRGIIDLLAVDFEGRLAVIELKASEDLHLPLQALDYWMRVKWHLERGDFARAGYFPGMAIRPEPPRLILAAPASAFHPTTGTILDFLASNVAVERLGLGLEWRREVKVAFRACRSQSSGN